MSRNGWGYGANMGMRGGQWGSGAMGKSLGLGDAMAASGMARGEEFDWSTLRFERVAPGSARLSDTSGGGHKDKAGSGGYLYRQFANGDITILQGALPGGRRNIAANIGDPVWVCITREIGAVGAWRGVTLPACSSTPAGYARAGRTPTTAAGEVRGGAAPSPAAQADLARSQGGFLSKVQALLGVGQQAAVTTAMWKSALGRRRPETQQAPSPAMVAPLEPSGPSPLTIGLVVAGAAVGLVVLAKIANPPEGE